MKFKFMGRKKENIDGKYVLPEDLDLSIESKITAGNGSGETPWILKAEISNKNPQPWEGVIRFQLSIMNTKPRFFMPAFLYGRNKGECGANSKWCYPRLRSGDIEMPYSPWWMVRSDRLSHPVTLAFEENRVLGVSGSPYFVKKRGKKLPWNNKQQGTFYQYAGFGCSLEEGWLCYTLGYENAPKMFINSSTIEERKPLAENCFRLEALETITLSLCLFDYPAENELGINKAIAHVYGSYHQTPRRGSDIVKTTEDLAEAIAEDAWVEEGKNYSTQVYEKEDGTLSFQKWFSISWTGGVEAAVPLLMAGLRLEKEKMRQQAISCIQNIVEHSLNPKSGLPYDACSEGIWSVDGWWRDHMQARGHASYLVGQAIFYILKGYDYEVKLGKTIHANWLAFAGKVICKMESTKNSDMEYPYIWSEKTGAGLEYDAFSGAWCMASAAYYCFLTGERTYIEGIIASQQHYYETYVKHMECYGTPLDTDKAVDSEGILAYIKAVRYLHMISPEETYLDHLRDALFYEYSFKFCYHSPIQIPPLSKLGWSSCGGSVTSTCNQHIHPMSNNVVDEMLYYLSRREDPYIQERLTDTVLWGCQTYNTYEGEYDYGKKGWMSERFCHSEALLVEKYKDGTPSSTWFALLPWGGANIIEGMTGDYWEVRKEMPRRKKTVENGGRYENK